MVKKKRRRYRTTPPGKCGSAFEARCIMDDPKGFTWRCRLFDRMGKQCGIGIIDTSKKPASIKFQD